LADCSCSFREQPARWVSTEKQGRSGLGLEAQREAVVQFLNGGKWRLAVEVVEVESGKRSDRPKLAEALRLCRLHGAVLLIAKLDRLARKRRLRLEPDGERCRVHRVRFPAGK
jgi:DNA invertase Pin-like site-specific DNA recombinase